jgi:hypothetical protein
MAEDYPRVPHDELMLDVPGSKVYFDLQARYSHHLTELSEETASDSVQLVALIMTPEVGKYATPENLYGIPYIRQICTNNKVLYEDITPAISEWSVTATPAAAPQYGNWSKEGAAYAAEMIAPILEKYKDVRSSRHYLDDERSETFGDATLENSGMDNNNDLAHGGHKKEYRYRLNAHGLRMNHDLAFPKVRQRVIFIGDSRILNPFIDDQNTIVNMLQAKFPEMELVNAGNMSCTLDDYVSLYQEKVRYAEPDLVILCTNGGDILDEFFTHRNRFSRNKKCYRPTEAEKAFYLKTFK